MMSARFDKRMVSDAASRFLKTSPLLLDMREDAVRITAAKFDAHAHRESGSHHFAFYFIRSGTTGIRAFCEVSRTEGRLGLV